jgi:hypothetical protein
MDSSMLSSTPGCGGAEVGTEVMEPNLTPCEHESQEYGQTVTGSSISAREHDLERGRGRPQSPDGGDRRTGLLPEGVTAGLAGSYGEPAGTRVEVPARLARVRRR